MMKTLNETRPKVLTGITVEEKTACGPVYVTMNPGEVFIRLGKAGGCAAAQNEAIGRVAALVLRLGGTHRMIIDELKGIQCHVGRSCADAVAEALKSWNRDVCPACNGKGEYSFPEATSVDALSDGYYPCDRCDGTGEVVVNLS